ncbi:hypothetical protein Tco_0233579 [Tanacetum coccineum]
MGLQYTKDSSFELTGFSDADYAGCKDTFKSTSSGAQFLGKNPISWSSKKQDFTAMSTVKAEYVSLSACYYQLADLFTKALSVDRFNYLVHRLGMRSLSPQELDRLGEFFGNFENSQCVSNDFLTRLIDFYQMVFMDLHGIISKTDQTVYFSRSYKAVKVRKEESRVNAIIFRNHKYDADIETCPYLDPVDAICTTLLSHSRFLTKDLVVSVLRRFSDRKMLREIVSSSFQDLEHEGGDTRSQGRNKVSRIRFVISVVRQIKAKDHDISILSKYIKLKIKIHDHKHAIGSSKRIPKNTSLQVSEVSQERIHNGYDTLRGRL